MKRIAIVLSILTGASGAFAAPATAQERALAIQWEGIGLVSGTVSVESTATGRLRIFLSNPDRECVGSLSSAAGEGAWALACPDTTTASGRFVSKGQDRGGDGTGIDNLGRKITFVVAPARQSAATPTPPQPPTTAIDPYAKPSQAQSAAAAPPPVPPPAAPAPARPTSSQGLAAAPSNTVTCGFLSVDTLPVRKPTVKCETSKRTANNGGNVEIAGFSMRLDPNDSYLRFYAEKDISGYGWRPMTADRIREDAERWSSKFKPRNMTAVIGGSLGRSAS